MQDGDNDLLSSLDDLDPFSSRRPAGGPRPSKFQPKLKGKMKSETPANAKPVNVKSEDVDMVKKEEDVAILKKEEDVAMVKEEEDVATVKKDEDLAMVKKDQPLQDLMIADNAIVPVADDPMDTECDEEEEKDQVVHEIDVFFNPAPLDEETLLYVMQHPLRPSWRPYELNERCEEVRVKPKQSKFEVDLSPVVAEGSYNPDVLENLNFKKQTLSSSKAPFVTDYAVGIMVGNQLHLNPVHAVVQLRHSKAYISGLQKKKQSGRSREGNTSEENLEGSSKLPVRQEKKVPEDLNEDVDDSEPWIPLEYHAADSVLSGRYKQKMVAEEYDCIQFAMTPSDFVLSLCPGITTSRNLEVPPSWVFDSLPLEEHLRRWLTEVSQVSRFNVIKHFSPANSSDEEVLRVLQLYAYLVQGLWVSKSSLVCSEPQQARVRDFFLILFSKNRVVPMKKLRTTSTNISEDLLKGTMLPLAKARPKLGDWKFREDTDESFIKRFPHIVEEQNRAWSTREKDIMDSLRARPVTTKSVPVIPVVVKKADIAGKVNPVTNEGKDGSSSLTSTTSTMLSNEAREALPKALSKLFQQQKVLSLSSITRGLRDTALRKASLRKDDQEKEIFVNAANGVCASLPDVKLLISKLAVDIHGLYVLRSDEKTETGQLRNIVINLFLGKEPNAKLQKQEIIDAAKLFLERDISDSEFHQVMNELCVNNKGSWSLKSGDMNTK